MFENDGAGDFFARLGTAGAGQRTKVIRHAVQAAADAAGYLEVDAGQAAIAAAGVVAAAGAGQPVTAADNGRTIEPDGLPARTRLCWSWPRALDPVADSDLEWYELWRGHAALGALAEVRAALT